MKGETEHKNCQSEGALWVVMRGQSKRRTRWGRMVSNARIYAGGTNPASRKGDASLTNQRQMAVGAARRPYRWRRCAEAHMKSRQGVGTPRRRRPPSKPITVAAWRSETS